MRKKVGLGALVLLCLLGIATIQWSREPGEALQITYLGATTNSMDRFGVTNRSRHAITQFGGPQIARHNENNAIFAGPTHHLARGEGFILDVPVLVPSGKQLRLELRWEYDWRWNLREQLNRLRPVQNGSIVDRTQDYLLPVPASVHSKWIRERVPKADKGRHRMKRKPLVLIVVIGLGFGSLLLFFGRSSNAVTMGVRLTTNSMGRAAVCRIKNGSDQFLLATFTMEMVSEGTWKPSGMWISSQSEYLPIPGNTSAQIGVGEPTIPGKWRVSAYYDSPANSLYGRFDDFLRRVGLLAGPSPFLNGPRVLLSQVFDEHRLESSKRSAIVETNVVPLPPTNHLRMRTEPK